jgi:serine/threonine-protein kinase RsbW
MAKVVKKDNRIIIPSSLNHLREVDEFIQQKLIQQGIGQSLVTDIAIAVTEAVTNAVCHGNRNDPQKKVDISLEMTNDRVTIKVKDRGSGFNPEAINNPLKEENLLKQAGRGIFIVKSLMDEVKFEIMPDNGTNLLMVKKI